MMEFSFRNDLDHPKYFNPMWRLKASQEWNVVTDGPGVPVRLGTPVEAEAIAARFLISAARKRDALLLDALSEADSFMTGFEDDEMQQGMDEMLSKIRGAVASLADDDEQLEKTLCEIASLEGDKGHN